MAQHCSPYSIQAERCKGESLNARPRKVCAALISTTVKLGIPVIEFLERTVKKCFERVGSCSASNKKTCY